MFVTHGTRRMARMAFTHRFASPSHEVAIQNTSQAVNSGKQGMFACTYLRMQSSSASSECSDYDPMGPEGDLFSAQVGPSLVGKKAQVKRIFGPRDNSIGLLTAGGEPLAKHASFDPEYNRARDWIRQHAVGPAVLSPVLILGLVGALVEAACPQSIPISCSMQQARPLIVGVEVCARIEVVAVVDSSKAESRNLSSGETPYRGEQHDRKKGYEVQFKTSVNYVRDDNIVAEGTHSVWIPDYLHM